MSRKLYPITAHSFKEDSMIVVNKIKCLSCGDEIVSELETMFKTCSCGKIKISGGQKDTIRVLSEGTVAKVDVDYTELSTFLLNE